MTFFRQKPVKARVLFREPKADYDSQSAMYKRIDYLLYDLYHIKSNAILNKYHNPTVLAAAAQMLGALEKLLKNDIKNPYSLYPEEQIELANNALNIIYQYKPLIEAEPGLWNQFKARINSFFEKYWGIPDVLSVRTTPFGEKNLSFLDAVHLHSVTTQFKFESVKTISNLEEVEAKSTYSP